MMVTAADCGTLRLAVELSGDCQRRSPSASRTAADGTASPDAVRGSSLFCRIGILGIHAPDNPAPFVRVECQDISGLGAKYQQGLGRS
jgi:hypothetical protein